MAETTTLSVRISAETKKRLARLAKSTKRSQAFLAAEAIDAYVDLNEWQVAGIEEGLASLDRGEYVSHEQIKDWADTLPSDGQKRRAKTA